MNLDQIVRRCRKISAPFRITNGKKFRLRDIDTDARGGFHGADKKEAQKALQVGVQAVCDYQERLYAQDQWAVLLIFQAIDAAGKDGAIKHVLSGVNPEGCRVHSFKTPTADDLDHDYLWRCSKELPPRGMIGVFNRSYYEEALVVRVHPELLQRQKLPPSLVGKKIWSEHFEDIRNFERYLSRNGVLIRKLFLHLSKEEQRKRFLERIDDPEKHWKFEAADLRERDHWEAYQTAFEAMVQQTASDEAPWYVVPADHKWFSRIVIGAAVVDALASLDLKFPESSKVQNREMRAAREELKPAKASKKK